MLTADLDAELARSLRVLAGDGDLPAVAIATGGTWRPAPTAGPAGYATSAPFEVARLARRSPGGVAAALAGQLAPLPWIESVRPSGGGYLTITVTAHALASVAPRIAAAGSACARSDLLRGTRARARPWPDLTAAASWEDAWLGQAEAMVSHLAAAAGAGISSDLDGERAAPRRATARGRGRSVADAVAHHGADVVRYWLARTPAGRVVAGDPRAPYRAVQVAHASAAATLRWAADLHLDHADPGDRLAVTLGTEPDRDVLALLSWLPVRVASAARRGCHADLPRYLERLAAAWALCRHLSPALPFGGAAAPRDPQTAGARLLLARAVATALAAGLTLTGVAASERI